MLLEDQTRSHLNGTTKIIQILLLRKSSKYTGTEGFKGRVFSSNARDVVFVASFELKLLEVQLLVEVERAQAIALRVAVIGALKKIGQLKYSLRVEP